MRRCSSGVPLILVLSPDGGEGISRASLLLFAGWPSLPLQTVGFSGGKFAIGEFEFALHFPVGGHRREVGLPSVAVAGHGHAGAVDETFQKGELSFG